MPIALAVEHLRLTLEDFQLLRATEGELRTAILALPSYVSDEDPLFNAMDLIATAKLVLDRVADDRR